ncbi:MAG: hypothetical protein WCB15_26985 [Desulfobacterales bacterium]
MRADGPGVTAGISLTLCISLSEEKAEIAAAVITVGNSAGPSKLAPYQNKTTL